MAKQDINRDDDKHNYEKINENYSKKTNWGENGHTTEERGAVKSKK